MYSKSSELETWQLWKSFASTSEGPLVHTIVRLESKKCPDCSEYKSNCGRKEGQREGGGGGGGSVAAILAVTSAVLHEDVVGAAPHEAETLISTQPGLAHISTASEVAPFTVYCKRNDADWNNRNDSLKNVNNQSERVIQ